MDTVYEKRETLACLFPLLRIPPTYITMLLTVFYLHPPSDRATNQAVTQPCLHLRCCYYYASFFSFGVYNDAHTKLYSFYLNSEFEGALPQIESRFNLLNFNLDTAFMKDVIAFSLECTFIIIIPIPISMRGFRMSLDFVVCVYVKNCELTSERRRIFHFISPRAEISSAVFNRGRKRKKKSLYKIPFIESTSRKECVCLCMFWLARIFFSSMVISFMT